MGKFKIKLSPYFERDYKKIRDNIVKKRLYKVFEYLEENPFDEILRTHKVNTPSLGKVWSSSVTGDLRILWKFSDENVMIIVALKLQGHDTVYN
jgi:mRNA-degrading endonuclease YafQ of YafQ-DinJ toxin-antitoxin module